MRYDKLTKKYGTDKMEDVYIDGSVYTNNEHINIQGTMKQQLHSAGFGDFIKDYIKHLNLPIWRRDFDWSLVEQIMRKALNQCQVQWHHR